MQIPVIVDVSESWEDGDRAHTTLHEYAKSQGLYWLRLKQENAASATPSIADWKI